MVQTLLRMFLFFYPMMGVMFNDVAVAVCFFLGGGGGLVSATQPSTTKNVFLNEFLVPICS